MARRELPRSILLLTSAGLVSLVLAASAMADFGMQQKAAVGFPIDGVIEIAQIDPGGNGAHRLAVLQGSYLMGLQWSPRRNGYDQTFFIQLDFALAGSSYGFGGSHMVQADVNADSRNDIVVFASYPSEGFAAYDSATGALLMTGKFLERPEIASDAVLAMDIDGVPGDEMIVTDSGVSAYKSDVRLWHSVLKGALLPQSRGALAHGEIFVATTAEVVVLDSHTGRELRRLPAGCTYGAVGQGA